MTWWESLRQLLALALPRLRNAFLFSSASLETTGYSHASKTCACARDLRRNPDAQTQTPTCVDVALPLLPLFRYSVSVPTAVYCVCTKTVENILDLRLHLRHGYNWTLRKLSLRFKVWLLVVSRDTLKTRSLRVQLIQKYSGPLSI